MRLSISKLVQLEMYARMCRIRFTEETIAKRYPKQEMRCPTHLSIGQEAVAVGVCQNLNEDDCVVSTHRSHAHYLAKNGDLMAMISELYGKANGCSAGKGGSMHLVDTSVGFMGSTAIVGNSIPIGAGLALAMDLKKTNEISCIFFGDGAVEEGVFAETINFVSVKQLPVLFICENNLYSVYSPLNVRQPPTRSIADVAQAMGVPSFSGDGNDVESVWEKTFDAVQKIRMGAGPQFIEFYTYRWLEHCGPNFDNDLGYRSHDEFLAWQSKDPLERYKSKLIKNGVEKDELDTLELIIRREVDEAFKYAENSPFPELSEMYSDEYQ